MDGACERGSGLPYCLRRRLWRFIDGQERRTVFLRVLARRRDAEASCRAFSQRLRAWERRWRSMTDTIGPLLNKCEALIDCGFVSLSQVGRDINERRQRVSEWVTAEKRTEPRASV